MTRILLITLMVFFVPSLILGMISPVVVKLTVVDLERTGNVVGKIYAFSTLGSILGTFATGFFLIEAMGTRTILYGVGAVLVLCAPIFGRLLARHAGARRGLAVGCLALMGAVLGLLWMERAAVARPFELTRDARGALAVDRLDADTFFKESSYYTLMVYDDPWHEDERVDDYVPVRTLKLDHLIHSYTHVGDPLYLAYDYLRIYEELVAWRKSGPSGTDRRNEFLFVGGGGYTLPRYLDAKYPDMTVDVVEIDPWVTKVAREQLGIDRTRVHSFNADGRWYVMNSREEVRLHRRRRLQRSVHPVPPHDPGVRPAPEEHPQRGWPPHDPRHRQSPGRPVPPHLYPDAARRLRRWPCPSRHPRHPGRDGDRHGDRHRGRFPSSAGHGGLQALPGRAYPPRAGRRGRARLVGSSGRASLSPPCPTSFRESACDAYMRTRARPPFVLRDDYVPADNLVAPMFEERYGYKKKGD